MRMDIKYSPKASVTELSLFVVMDQVKSGRKEKFKGETGSGLSYFSAGRGEED